MSIDDTTSRSSYEKPLKTRRAAQNARRHGLAAPVPRDEALTIYRELLDNPDRVRASFVTDVLDRLLWAYAETEAQVARAIRAERSHLFGRMPVSELPVGPMAECEEGVPCVLSVDTLRDIILSDAAEDIDGLVRTSRISAFWREADMLRRYRREAETRRRKAFRAYVRAVKTEDGGI